MGSGAACGAGGAAGVADDDVGEDLVDLRMQAGSSLTPAAATFSRTCSGREAPMMAAATFGFCSTQATASWARVSPASRGDRREQPGTAVSTSSFIQPADEVGAAGLVGGARARGRRAAPGAYLPVSTPCAMGEKHDLADALLLAERDHLGLDHPPQHVVLRLVGHDPVKPQLARRPQRRARSARPATPTRRCRGPSRRARGRRTPASSPRAASRGRTGAPGTGRRSRSAGGAASCRCDSVMCLRDRPRLFGPGAGRPVDLGEDLQRTRGARPRAPGRAPPRPARPRTRRRCRRWRCPRRGRRARRRRAASSSIWEPWVIQLP